MEKLGPADFESGLDLFGNTSRRMFVKGLGFVSVSLLLTLTGGCESIRERIRNRPVRRCIRAGSAEVDADLATYAQAVSEMMDLPASDDRRWLSQAYIHGTPAGFNWCEHSSDHFFDWHRAYLLYFERICRELTGNESFGLPYWNWNQNPGVPQQFLDSGSSLFSQRQRTSMAGHTAVSDDTLDPMLQNPNFFQFQAQIEATPHNNVHSYIAGQLGQYDSPIDPLFWVHHCMVDYIWWKWNGELGNDNPNSQSWGAFQDEEFVDQEGDTARMAAVLTPILPLLSYRYESCRIGGFDAVAEASGDDFRRLESRLRAGADVRFAVSERYPLAERAAVSIARPVSLRSSVTPADFARLVESRTAERLFLNVNYARNPPNTDFNVRVFVNLPEANARTSTDNPHYAGSFAFFGTAGPSVAGAGERAEPPSRSPRAGHHRPRFLVDLTQAVQRLRARGLLEEDTPLSIQLVPTPYGESFVSPEVELVLERAELITTPVLVSDRPQRDE